MKRRIWLNLLSLVLALGMLMGYIPVVSAGSTTMTIDQPVKLNNPPIIGEVYVIDPETGEPYSQNANIPFSSHLDLNGGVSVQRYIGNDLTKYHIKIDWGDGSPLTTGILIKFEDTAREDGKYYGTWTAQHDFSIPKPYTIYIWFYHAQANGNDELIGPPCRLDFGKTAATVTLDNLSQTYTGSLLSPTATTDPSGLAIIWNNAPQTNVGSYEVTATIDNTDYAGSASGTFIISKATPSVTAWPTASAITYGQALGASALSGGSASVEGSFAFTDHTIIPDAGTYSASVTFTPTDGDNFYTVTGSVDVTVNKATALVTLDNLNQTYDGTTKIVTATTSPVGLKYVVTYKQGGVEISPVAAGSYDVVATIDNTDYTGSANGTLIIDKAQSIITVIVSDTIYDGKPQGGTATVTGDGGLNETLTVSYTGRNTTTYGPSTTAPTNAGDYTASATYTGSANYYGSSGSKDYTIFKADATKIDLNLESLNQVYDGTPKSVTVTTVPADLKVDITYGGSTDAPVNAGEYAVVATIDNNDYTGSVSGTLTISKADTTNDITGWSGTYDGKAHGASGQVYGVNGVALSGLDLGASFTDVPGGTANWKFTDVTGNYNDASDSVDIVINKATPSVTAWPTASAITYGQALSDSVLSGGSASVEGSFDFTDKTITPNAGPYSASVTFTPRDTANYNTVTGSVDVTVNKATALVTLDNLNQTYTGSPLTPTAATTPSGLTIIWTGAPQTNAGSYKVTATINENNYAGSASDTFVISPAGNVISFNPPASATFGDAPITLTASASSGLPVSLAVTSGPATLEGNVLTITGAGNIVITASQAGDANHVAATNVVKTIVVGKATGATSVILSNLSQTYDGTHKSVSVTTNPAGLNVIVKYNDSADLPVNAGSYAVMATIDNTDYAGSANGTLTINKADAKITVKPYSVTYDGKEHTATGTATGVEKDTPTDLNNLLNLEGTTHTKVGDWPSDPWTFAGNNNYNSVSGTVHDEIIKNTSDDYIHTSPVAWSDSYDTDENVTLVVPASGVLDNDNVYDGYIFEEAKKTTDPAHGTLTLNGDGSFTYVPDTEFVGSDSFKYQVKDSAGYYSNITTVTITVNETEEITPPTGGTNELPLDNTDITGEIIETPTTPTPQVPVISPTKPSGNSEPVVTVSSTPENNLPVTPTSNWWWLVLIVVAALGLAGWLVFMIWKNKKMLQKP